MKPFKASLAAIGACLLVYLGVCFIKAGFDISHWTENDRAACAWAAFLFGAMAFCTAKSLE